jgi:hypothetical protein
MSAQTPSLAVMKQICAREFLVAPILVEIWEIKILRDYGFIN